MISQLLYLLSLFVPFALGIVLAKRITRLDGGLADRFTSLTFYILIATIGFRIGRTRDLLVHLNALGIIAAVFAVCTVSGTLLVLTLLYLPIRGRMPRRASTGTSGRSNLLRLLIDPIILVLLLGVGVLLGVYLRVLPQFNGERLITLLLCALLFFIGVSFAQKRIPFRRIVGSPDLLLLPVGTAIGMGGATSMDVTLPVIERSLGPESAPLAMVSGALLSAGVPLLVPLFYHLG